LNQKVALITAAGSGMGAGVARKLAEQNYKVAILSSSGKGEALAQELGGIGEISDEDWHLGMEVYFLHAVRISRLVTPIMIEGGGGAIVNISTFAAFEPDPVFPTSGAFRSSLAAFTKLYADEYAAKNIRMNNLLPGFIDSLPEKEEFRSRIPMERYGTVDEIAETAAFLVSDGAAYITGQNLRVDGGITRAV